MTEDEVFKLELIITGAKEAADGVITEWELNFLIGIEEKLEQYGERSRVSDKQWAVLDRIYDKVC